MLILETYKAPEMLVNYGNREIVQGDENAENTNYYLCIIIGTIIIIC